MTMDSQPTFCPYAKDDNGSTTDDNTRLATLFASIDQAKSARDARDAEVLAKLRRKHDIALDAVMQALPRRSLPAEASVRPGQFLRTQAQPKKQEAPKSSASG